MSFRQLADDEAYPDNSELARHLLVVADVLAGTGYPIGHSGNPVMIEVVHGSRHQKKTRWPLGTIAETREIAKEILKHGHG